MKSKTLIPVGQLAEQVSAGELLILDCRWELSDPASGRSAHEQGHVPGAIHVNLDTELSDLSRSGLGRHPLPFENAFSKTLSRWGWQPGRSVVAYDDAGGALAAARLWWMLRLIGAGDCQVLDGGYAAWRKAGLPIETHKPVVAASDVSIEFDAQQLIEFDALQRGLDEASVLLVDARGPARYRGETEPLDRLPGHVPDAINRPFSDNLDADGFFRPGSELARDFIGLIGRYPADAVVHMCGSGVSACHNLLAMEHAGLHGSRLFAPSWSGWISDPARPVKIGADP